MRQRLKVVKERYSNNENVTGDRDFLPLELYVHIPFCVKKCLYCDFYSGPASKEAQKAYVERVSEEIRSTAFGHGENERVTSVYFGGGTPSILPGEDLTAVLRVLYEQFDFIASPEITVECNPGTVSPEKLSAYRAWGVNRLSFGLQSTENEVLKKIGRIHTFEDFLESYRTARRAGFGNISVDLISGLPGDTPETFEKGLKTVIALSPEHLSVYSLILEENTELYALNKAGRLALPSEEDEREMAHAAVRMLEEAGYRQYEISNFARPGFRSLHNVGYWTGVPYLGFGSAAASYYDGKRFRNALSLQYSDLPYEETEVLTEEDRMNEFLMLGLRMTEGVSGREFERRFGRSFDDFKGESLRNLLEEGLLIREKKPDGDETVRLSAYGKDLANYVFREFV